MRGGSRWLCSTGSHRRAPPEDNMRIMLNTWRGCFDVSGATARATPVPARSSGWAVGGTTRTTAAAPIPTSPQRASGAAARSVCSSKIGYVASHERSFGCGRNQRSGLSLALVLCSVRHWGLSARVRLLGPLRRDGDDVTILVSIAGARDSRRAVFSARAHVLLGSFVFGQNESKR